MHKTQIEIRISRFDKAFFWLARKKLTTHVKYSELAKPNGSLEAETSSNDIMSSRRRSSTLSAFATYNYLITDGKPPFNRLSAYGGTSSTLCRQSDPFPPRPPTARCSQPWLLPENGVHDTKTTSNAPRAFPWPPTLHLWSCDNSLQ